MYAVRPANRARLELGVNWPLSGSHIPSVIGDAPGHRTFSVLHNNDFHRGPDVGDGGARTDPAGSPVCGYVTRRHFSHFGWTNSAHLDQFTEANAGDPTYSIVDEELRITGVNDGTVANLSDRSQMRHIHPFDADVSSDWMMDLRRVNVGLTGRIEFGVVDYVNDEYIYVQFNGTNVYVFAKDSGGVIGGLDGEVSANVDQWLRIKFNQSASTLSVQSTNVAAGDTMSDIENDEAIPVPITAGVPSWTNPRAFTAFIGFSPAAAGADDSIDIPFFGFFGEDGIGRFGNWIEISTAVGRWFLMHLDHFVVDVGDYIDLNQLVGYIGNSGFDDYSGRVKQIHLHIEYIPDRGTTYGNDLPIHPMGDGLLPHGPGLTAVFTVDDTPDPDTNASHRLIITLTRDVDQAFILNQIKLTGNTTTRTINFDTRAGLDPANHDAQDYNGVYFDPQLFNESSSEMVYHYYFNKATVGNTFVSAEIQDMDGNVMGSL